jgi:hypothetical protein
VDNDRRVEHATHPGAIMSDPIYCRRCGTQLKGESRFCTSCGGTTGPDAPSGASADPAGTIRWRVEVPLVTNRFIMLDVVLGSAATVALCGVIFAAIFGSSGGMKGVVAGFTAAAWAGVVLLVMSVLVLALIFGNKWPLEFVINEDGVVQNNISERAHAINRFSWILALLTGRPLMAGPGLIAQSREVVGIAWDEVRRVRRYPALGVIGIRGGFLDNVRLFCLPSNYADVAQRVEAMVKQHAPGAVVT